MKITKKVLNNKAMILNHKLKKKKKHIQIHILKRKKHTQYEYNAETQESKEFEISNKYNQEFESKYASKLQTQLQHLRYLSIKKNVFLIKCCQI